MNTKLAVGAIATGAAVGFLIPVHPFVNTSTPQPTVTQTKTVTVKATPKATPKGPVYDKAGWPSVGDDQCNDLGQCRIVWKGKVLCYEKGAECVKLNICEGAPTQEPGTGDFDVYVDSVGQSIINPGKSSIKEFHLKWIESCEES